MPDYIKGTNKDGKTIAINIDLITSVVLRKNFGDETRVGIVGGQIDLSPDFYEQIKPILKKDFVEIDTIYGPALINKNAVYQLHVEKYEGENRVYVSVPAGQGIPILLISDLDEAIEIFSKGK